nr:TAXI family TRAP transporter solute-binding subunit [Streptomyces luteolifulvus]
MATEVAGSGRRLEIAPASVDNLRKLAGGSVELALTMADAAQDAVLGREPFARRAAATALARGYVNYTHLVVRADGPVRSLDDLAGRPVAAGASVRIRSARSANRTASERRWSSRCSLRPSA